MKFNGSSGVQVRMPSNLQDLAAYTSLKFYIQNPEPRSRQRRQDETEEGRFVLYLGSREVRQDGAGTRRAVGARAGGIHGGSHLDISPCPFTSVWGAQAGSGWRMGRAVRMMGLGQCNPGSIEEHHLVLLPVPNANTWPCRSLNSGHRRLPGHRAQGPQSAVDLQTGQ